MKLGKREFRREYFKLYNMLPEDIAKKAKDNFDPSFARKSPQYLPEDAADAIHEGFSWKDSPEGHNFWENVFIIISNGCARTKI